VKRVLLIAGALIATAAGWLVYELNARPSLDRYSAMAFESIPDDDAGGLRVTFLGVATLLIRDATSALMIDGFFSRPGMFDTAVGRIGPDRERIEAALARAGVEHLDAVITVHSHYDHAMDTPVVAALTGALVVGSASTANIARGQGTPEENLRIVTGTQTMQFGDLKVTMIPTAHFPHGQAMGEITSPLVPPARATDYLEGGSFSILIEREAKSILVHGSAGYAEGALAGRHADVVYLGVGLLGSKDAAYRDTYWREAVQAVGAKRVIPIHWDDFTRPLDEPLIALPYLFDDLDASMTFVTARAKRDGIDLRWPLLWQKVDPFSGL